MTSTIIPALRYRDPDTAIAWLCEAFGFEEHLVARGDDGAVVHAQLVLNGGMLMLGPFGQHGEYDKFIAMPDEAGNRETQSPYLVVADADKQFEQAKATGAKIIMEIADQDQGGRLFTCLDPEGHLWSVGDYDPWHET